MELLVSFFKMLMDWSHELIPNYWMDIVLFTAITKVLQFPLSLWCHANSLKMVALMPKTNGIKLRYFGDSDKIGEETAALFKREHYHPLLSLLPLAVQIIILMGFVKVIYGIAGGDKSALIARIPVEDGGVAWLMPLAAGAAAWLLGYFQNRINPLQHEQSRAQQITTNGISIGISLFLGAFVAMGVGLYWATSNVLSILVQVCCNVAIKPSGRVDYKALESSKIELLKLESSLKKVVSKEDLLREKRDYKRFFHVANKHLVFYSEGSGYYKYFESLINWLLAHSNITIHYITNDPKDKIFSLAEKEPRIRAYYIGHVKIIPLMMKMDADMVVMTTPDLDTYQIKRSYVRKDVEYVYLCHGPNSTHMCTRKGAYDNFDTIFCSGKFMADEIRATERVYGLKAKTLVPTGYLLFDTLFAQYKKSGNIHGAKVRILVAPSYQDDNILDSCIDGLLNSLMNDRYLIIVRPHPQYIRRQPAKIKALVERFSQKIGEGLQFELDFSSNSSIYLADLLVTDWSSIAYEFSFTTKRPTLFVNTKMKVINPEYTKIGIIPTDIWMRDKVGVVVEKTEMPSVKDRVQYMLSHREQFAGQIEKILVENFFNPGCSSSVAGKYILETLINKKKGTKK